MSSKLISPDTEGFFVSPVSGLVVAYDLIVIVVSVLQADNAASDDIGESRLRILEEYIQYGHVISYYLARCYQRVRPGALKADLQKRRHVLVGHSRRPVVVLRVQVRYPRDQRKKLIVRQTRSLITGPIRFL